MTLREECLAMIAKAVADSPYGFIVALQPPTKEETRDHLRKFAIAKKHREEQDILRDGIPAVALSNACADHQQCVDCDDLECWCDCHREE